MISVLIAKARLSLRDVRVVLLPSHPSQEVVYCRSPLFSDSVKAVVVSIASATFRNANADLMTAVDHTISEIRVRNI
jgi:hypothetical protein